MKRTVLTSLSVALLAGALCAAAAGRTTLEVKDGKIVVTLYVAFQGGTDELVGRWAQEIRGVWNGPDGRQEYPGCKHQVVFVVNTMNVPKGQPFPRGWHRVEVKEYDGKETSLPRADGQYAIAYMGKTTRSPSVAGASIDGVWSTRASAPVDPRTPLGERFKDAAHEAGHMMGLPDFYDRKTKREAEHLMGQTSGPHAKVTAELIPLLVAAISGKYRCPICQATRTQTRQ